MSEVSLRASQSDRILSDGATLALLSALSGALIAQLSVFQRPVPASIVDPLLVGISVILICLASLLTSRSFIEGNRKAILWFVVLLVSIAYFLSPEILQVSEGGLRYLDKPIIGGIPTTYAKDAGIKILVVSYVLGWNGFATLLAFRDRDDA